jgi:quercetin dioxygenase-like cupin family protein
MRTLIIAPLFLAAAAAPPAAAPQTHATLDVPRGRAQQVLVQSRDFAPGMESGWHIHPGTEVAYITAGQLELQVKGKTTVLEPGDSFTMPRGVPHNGANHGAQTAHVVITLVVDAGRPLRQAVTAP